MVSSDLPIWKERGTHLSSIELGVTIDRSDDPPGDDQARRRDPTCQLRRYFNPYQ